MNFSWLYNLFSIAIRGLSLLAKFLLILFLVKYFQPQELGLYGMMTAVIAYALFFLGLEFYNYTSRALVNASAHEQALIIKEQFILYTLAFTLLAPLFYLLFYWNIVPTSLCYWFFLITLVEHISNELMRILLALARPHLANLIFFVRQGLWIYILLAVFYFQPESRDFNWIFAAWALGAAFSILIAMGSLYYLPWSAVWRIPIRWGQLKQGVRISQPFIISAFCALSLLYIERFFIGYYCGIEAIGIYTFYAGLSITLYTLIQTGVSRIRLPHLISAWKQNNQQLFYKESMHMLKCTIIFVIAFSIMSICLIYPFIKLIGKPVYLNNINIFYFLMFGAVCRSIGDVPIYTLYAQHKDKLILVINLGAFLILILGNIVLTPQLGLIGAAISSASASFALLCYAMLTMMRKAIRPLLFSHS